MVSSVPAYTRTKTDGRVGVEKLNNGNDARHLGDLWTSNTKGSD